MFNNMTIVFLDKARLRKFCYYSVGMRLILSAKDEQHEMTRSVLLGQEEDSV